MIPFIPEAEVYLKQSGYTPPTQTPGKSSSKKVKKVQKEKKKVPCQFCGEESTDFDNEVGMDEHLVNECKMLGQCPGCQQVIEVTNINEHLVTECQNKKNYQPCKTCKMSVAKSDSKAHKKTCKKTNQPDATCPLCFNVVGARQEDWTDHLVKNGCPKGQNRSNG